MSKISTQPPEQLLDIDRSNPSKMVELDSIMEACGEAHARAGCHIAKATMVCANDTETTPFRVPLSPHVGRRDVAERLLIVDRGLKHLLLIRHREKVNRSRDSIQPSAQYLTALIDGQRI
jgi:hypothetical protein